MSFWEIFWAYKETLAEHGIKGFSIFSLTHIIWIAILVSAIIAYSLAYKRGDEKRRDNLRKGAAVFLILFELLKLSVIALTGAPIKNFVPLEICSFAEYAILFDAMWPGNKILKPILFFEFYPAAVIAILLPTATAYPGYNFFAIHQFLFHGAIVAYIAARCAAGDIRYRYSGLWLTVGAIVITMIPVYISDKSFGTNHMFLTYHSNNPALKMIWNLSGGEGGIPYVIGLAIFVILVIHVWYGGWLLAGLIAKRKKKN